MTYDSAPGYFSQFCKIGQDMFPEISRELPCDIEFEPEGLGLLVDDERDMETVLANYEGKKNEGVDVTFWDRDELLRHEPHVSDKVIACLNFNGDAKLNPMRLCFGLAELARQKGAKAFNRTAVTGITVKNGAVQSVETSSGSIATKKVVLASGVWTPGLGDMVGVKVADPPPAGADPRHRAPRRACEQELRGIRLSGGQERQEAPRRDPGNGAVRRGDGA